jgi:hypothetical protein
MGLDLHSEAAQDLQQAAKLCVGDPEQRRLILMELEEMEVGYVGKWSGVE